MAERCGAFAYKQRDLARNAEQSLAQLMSLDISKQRVKTVIVAHPELLCVPLDAWVGFLQSYGVSRRDCFRLASLHPRVLTHGSVYGAGNVISFLQGLGLSPRDVANTVIPQCPALLLEDLEGQLRPVVHFLRELGMQEQTVKDLACRCPRALTQHVGRQLAPKVAYLHSVGFPPDHVAAVLSRNAALLIQDLPAAVEARLGFLRQAGFSAPEARALLVSCPDILSLTLPNLGRKWGYLVERMGGGPADVLAFPRYFAAGLLNDIGPRYAYARDTRMLGALQQQLQLQQQEQRCACSAGGGAGVSSGGGGQEGAERPAPSVALAALLDCDNGGFVRRLMPARTAAAAAREGAGGSGVDVAEEADEDEEQAAAAAAFEEAQQAYADYRATWLETEGVKWSGVNAVSMAGDSW